MTMATHDNAPPPPDWEPEPRAQVIDLDARRARTRDEIPAHIVVGEN